MEASDGLRRKHNSSGRRDETDGGREAGRARSMSCDPFHLQDAEGMFLTVEPEEEVTNLWWSMTNRSPSKRQRLGD